VKKPRRPYIL
nr:neurotensin-related peptide [Cynops pyrrhogaster]